jgi:hypothetical protein
MTHTGVSDLTPLAHSPLRELNMEGCLAITDLHPLMAIATLESVLIPMQVKDISFLRNHPGIKRISYQKMTEPAADFWKAYDAKQAKNTPKAPVPSEGDVPPKPAAKAMPAASDKPAATPASEQTTPKSTK